MQRYTQVHDFEKVLVATEDTDKFTPDKIEEALRTKHERLRARKARYEEEEDDDDDVALAGMDDDIGFKPPVKDVKVQKKNKEANMQQQQQQQPQEQPNWNQQMVQPYY